MLKVIYTNWSVILSIVYYSNYLTNTISQLSEGTIVIYSSVNLLTPVCCNIFYIFNENFIFISGFIEPPVGRFTSRRKSVFAETYDPEEDEDDGPKVVFPKTDEQRTRLAEAVRNILLFRALDKEQMQDVLDAMFEKKVMAGDYIIKQGDDGDNFYVIQE